MSISIYYTARRATPLTDGERLAIAEIEAKFSVEDKIRQQESTGNGFNWESFCIYDPARPSESDVIFEGATRLPDNSEDAVWAGLKHWCRALTEIRRNISDAEWDVRVDDHEIPWDESAHEFDPTQ